VDHRLRPTDLAPGDTSVAASDWSAVSVNDVRSPADPDFAHAFERLWAEFGGRGEMERREVIAARLAWDPARPIGRTALLYELLVLRRRNEVVAMRDHTAVVRRDDGGRARPTVVHLSHALVEPAHRGSGLAGWLRALPLETARRCALAAGCTGSPIILVAEMEHPDPADLPRMTRLRSYERAGFRKIDPAAAPYSQPDFRPPEALAGATPVPVPLSLIVRRVGAENEDTMPAAEVATVVESIYAVYGVHVAPAALVPLRAAAAEWTARDASFRLVPPTA
jgi:GNAT superfamily N-acetyltransferase